MSLFTEKEALETIFEKNKTLVQYRVFKHRYKKGRLSDKVIKSLLLKYKFISAQIALYKKNEVQPKYIHLEIEHAFFKQIFKSKTTSVEIEKEKYLDLVSDNLKFIRFTYKKWYMDVTIRKIITNETILIHLSQIIDYNKPKQ